MTRYTADEARTPPTRGSRPTSKELLRRRAPGRRSGPPLSTVTRQAFGYQSGHGLARTSSARTRSRLARISSSFEKYAGTWPGEIGPASESIRRDLGFRSCEASNASRDERLNARSI